ncbi:hypothetical protein [Peptostreptococcus equinus]|uniref:Uncharacterized protein n=1 Tax=Peptostreptococcus equinus TaxID=3003601 RepID=A0ABY7JN24_9FIRM|nr:hypothetical protein [Peptostreptococcus sp. CBA3647]WAW14773.1 hypothetical protein O0R46_09335 [Peptostreptococcus sp. CBA3647]
MKNKKGCLIGLIIFFSIGLLINLVDNKSVLSSINNTKVEHRSEVNTQTKNSQKKRSGVTLQSKKDIKDLDISFKNSMRNDVTGNYRLSKFSEMLDFNEFIISYGNKYFNSKNEVHFIINFANKTTAVLRDMGDHYYVTYHGYVDNEEHDAKKIPSGMVLSKYNIYKNNGDIEDLNK